MQLMGIWLAVAAWPGGADPPFDHDHQVFADFLAGAVDARGVDYDLLAKRKDRLDTYLVQVAEAATGGMTDAQKLALYVNAYNAYTLKVVLEAGPPASIRDLDEGKVWDSRRFVVAGSELTLNEMEHGHARKLADGRVHAVVNCASRGCPPLPPQPLRPGSVDAQLTEAARRWVATNAVSVEADTVGFNKIFEWYADDFTSFHGGDLPGVDGPLENAAWFVLAHGAPEATAAGLRAGTWTATWAEYDWSLNRQ